MIKKGIIILTLAVCFLLSCDKGPVCYTCAITTRIYKDPPTPPNPILGDAYVEKCDVTDKDIRDFINSRKGTSTDTRNGITYTTTVSVSCWLKD